MSAAGSARNAAARSYEAQRRSVVREAKAAYFDVLRAEALLGVSRDAVDAARANAEAAQRKFDIGLAPRAEVLRWSVMVAEDEKALADAETAVTMSRTQLANVLGLGLDRSFQLVEVERADLDSRYEELAWLTAPDYLTEFRARGLLSDNPDFAALEDVTRMARSGVTAARGAFLPALNATGSYGWKADDDIDPDDETAWSITLALELPVFTSFKNLSDYQQSRRGYSAALARQEDNERAMVAGLRGAVSALAASSKALTAAQKLVDQSADHLKSVQNRYKEGLASYAEFADAQVLFDRGRIGYVNAVYDGFLAVADVERLLGESPVPVAAGGDESTGGTGE
jgi:outer membrane protein